MGREMFGGAGMRAASIGPAANDDVERALPVVGGGRSDLLLSGMVSNNSHTFGICCFGVIHLLESVYIWVDSG